MWSMGASGSPCFAVMLSIGSVLCKIVNFLLTSPITCSTWILTFASFLVYSTSRADNCFLPLVKAGIYSLAPWNPTLSAMLNPLSASTMSPGNKFFRMPLFSVRYLSLITLSLCPPPPQALEINDITPWGVIPIRNLTVLVFIVGPCHCSSNQARWPVYKYLKAINYYCYLVAKVLFENQRHCLS